MARHTKDHTKDFGHHAIDIKPGLQLMSDNETRIVVSLDRGIVSFVRIVGPVRQPGIRQSPVDAFVEWCRDAIDGGVPQGAAECRINRAVRYLEMVLRKKRSRTPAAMRESILFCISILQTEVHEIDAGNSIREAFGTDKTRQEGSSLSMQYAAYLERHPEIDSEALKPPYSMPPPSPDDDAPF